MGHDTSEKIAFLERFKADIQAHFNGDEGEALRSRISRAMPRARRILSEAGALKSITLSPPPAIGGLIVRDADPFGFILQDYYGMSMIPTVADMIEEGIGVLESPEYEERVVGAGADAQRRDSTTVGAPPGAGTPPASEGGVPRELPDKVTLAWLVQNVPVSFWLWLVGLLVAAILAGVRIGPLLPDF